MRRPATIGARRRLRRDRSDGPMPNARAAGFRPGAASWIDNAFLLYQRLEKNSAEFGNDIRFGEQRPVAVVRWQSTRPIAGREYEGNAAPSQQVGDRLDRFASEAHVKDGDVEDKSVAFGKRLVDSQRACHDLTAQRLQRIL